MASEDSQFLFVTGLDGGDVEASLTIDESRDPVAQVIRIRSSQLEEQGLSC
jgi:hypothetical protein